MASIICECYIDLLLLISSFPLTINYYSVRNATYFSYNVVESKLHLIYVGVGVMACVWQY